MPPVAVCGRFDNAPAHVIIISTRFNPREVGAGRDPAPRPTKEVAEARRIEKLNQSIAKAALKKERDAAERLLKMDLVRKKEAKAKRAKAGDWLPGESKDHRKRRREREARQAREKILIDALPIGYEPLRGISLPVCYDVARNALSKRHVHGVKIGQAWYTSAAVIVAYFEQNHARHLESLKRSRKRGTK